MGNHNQPSIAIVTTQWHSSIIDQLWEGCTSYLEQQGVSSDQINTQTVPGSFELPLGAQYAANYYNPDAVICLGCIIKGETKHNEYIAHAVAQGIMDLNLKFNLPFIFGVVTTQNKAQAQARAGGKKGNKGESAARTALQMVELQYESSPS